MLSKVQFIINYYPQKINPMSFIFKFISFFLCFGPRLIAWNLSWLHLSRFVNTIQRYGFPHHSGLFLHPQSSPQQSTLGGHQRTWQAYPREYSEQDRIGICSKAVTEGFILVDSLCLLLSIHYNLISSAPCFFFL